MQKKYEHRNANIILSNAHISAGETDREIVVWRYVRKSYRTKRLPQHVSL